ncbi:unnamed protein product [Allacma fusca]|uniref:Peptidase M14 domain-containing protein n=1 Tax=Allacma fusca TaxID=39272 RepID=A0A8J2K612_9HEXA|nr:unnamed protein product [Allacma fusca]
MSEGGSSPESDQKPASSAGFVMSVLELQTQIVMSEEDIRNQAFIQGTPDGSSAKEKATGKLKEPRDLYSTASLQHVPKWPIECQVIPEKIRHKETVYNKLEPFYTTSSAENQPKPVGEELGTVIFNYQPRLSVDYFCRASAGGSEELQFFETDSNTLKFESRFESGNLAKVIKVTNVYYELYLRPDLYTDRHSQWFYFRIQNTKENITYRFSIVNLNKPDSLYRYGLKPLMYSEKDAQLNNVGWVRCGQNISYYKNDIMADENNSFYTLTFTLRFRHSNDTVFLAQCYPYTYTKLQNYLASVEADEQKSELCQQRLLCRSLAGNNIYVLTITSPDNHLEENVKKPVVVISARVHPGETQSSFMMKGIIDFLTSNFSQAKDLRERFIFKLIPMLNPDGVIVGNSRCCLLGQDLNRQYRTVLREAFPQIYHTKVMLRRLMEENGIFLYCDLHGHSRRNNVFMYGCENKRIPEKRLVEQVFPLMMHKNASDKFSFQNCKFKIQRSKEGTGRVFAWTLGVNLSYTLEVSLGGSTLPSRQQTHFNAYDYEAMGRHFCETLLDYSDNSSEKERLRDRIIQKLLEQGSSADEPLNVPISDYSSLSHSESDDSGDDAEAESEKKCVKRSTSIRRQSSTRISKKIKPKSNSNLKIERSVLTVSKASVDYVRTGQKQRKMEEIIGETQKEQEKEFHDSMARLSKFKRRSKRVNFQTPVEKPTSPNVNFLSTRCTSILFDDPFNPPAPDVILTTQTRIQFGEETGMASVTEDECDDSDSTFKNKKYLPQVSVSEIVDDLANLQLSSNATAKTLEIPDQTPVVISPSSPTSKPFKPRLKIPTPIPDQSIYTKSERRPAVQKQKAVRRESFCMTLNTLSETRSAPPKAFSKELYEERIHKVSLPSSHSRLQQRRVSWTGVTSSVSVSSGGGHVQTKAHDGIVSVNAAAKKETLSKKTLKKSKSMGDKLDEAANSNKYAFHLSATFNNNGTGRKKKSKVKRSKSRK